MYLNFAIFVIMYFTR